MENNMIIIGAALAGLVVGGGISHIVAAKMEQANVRKNRALHAQIVSLKNKIKQLEGK